MFLFFSFPSLLCLFISLYYPSLIEAIPISVSLLHWSMSLLYQLVCLFCHCILCFLSASKICSSGYPISLWPSYLFHTSVSFLHLSVISLTSFSHQSHFVSFVFMTIILAITPNFIFFMNFYMHKKCSKKRSFLILVWC